VLLYQSQEAYNPIASPKNISTHTTQDYIAKQRNRQPEASKIKDKPSKDSSGAQTKESECIRNPGKTDICDIYDIYLSHDCHDIFIIKS
jgi:hypothetical protein